MRNPRVAEILSVIADRGDEEGGLPARLCTACLSALSVSGVGVALMTALSRCGSAPRADRQPGRGSSGDRDARQMVSAVAAEVVNRHLFFDDSDSGTMLADQRGGLRVMASPPRKPACSNSTNYRPTKPAWTVTDPDAPWPATTYPR